MINLHERMWPTSVGGAWLKEIKILVVVELGGDGKWKGKARAFSLNPAFYLLYKVRFFFIGGKHSHFNLFIPADQHGYLCKQCRSRWDKIYTVCRSIIEFWLNPYLQPRMCPNSEMDKPILEPWGVKGLTHCILNRTFHTIYWKSPILILGMYGYEI